VASLSALCNSAGHLYTNLQTPANDWPAFCLRSCFVLAGFMASVGYLQCAIVQWAFRDRCVTSTARTHPYNHAVPQPCTRPRPPQDVP
jgi:hypothetical protein